MRTRIFVVVAAVAAGSASAVTTVWTGPSSGGNFADPANWSNGVPGTNADDVAIFNATRNVNGTITFAGSVMTSDLYLQNTTGRIDFDIGPHSYEMTRYTLLGSSAGQSTHAVFHSGTMSSGLVLIGNAPGAVNNKLTVSGANTFWSAAGPTAAIRIGSNGGSGSELLVTDGATVASSTQAIIGLQSASNNTLTVRGAGSTFSAVHSLSLGDNIGATMPDQTNNRLNVFDGGFVTVRELIIGTTEKSPDNTVTVSGVGSRLNVRGGQQSPPTEVGQRNDVGRSSVNNRLLVENGGVVDGGAIFLLGRFETSTGNLLSVTDASLSGTGVEIRRGRLFIRNGSVEINRVIDGIIGIPLGGLLSATLPTAEIDFASGTLATVNAHISTGQPLVVGDGGAVAASYRMKRSFDGSLGSHTFANGLAIASNGVLRGVGVIHGNVSVTGRVEPGVGAGASKIVGNLTIDLSAGGTADLGDNGLVIDWTGVNPVQTIRGYIANARNAGGGGLWTGSGITSTLAAADPSGAIGYADNGQAGFGLTSFLGQTVDVSSVLIRYTLAGDADLDGTVDLGDFARLAANFNSPAVWSGGDFDYDGQAGIGDFSLLAANFNQSLPAPTARGGAVPEPGSAVLVGLAGTALVRRRRAR